MTSSPTSLKLSSRFLPVGITSVERFGKKVSEVAEVGDSVSQTSGSPTPPVGLDRMAEPPPDINTITKSLSVELRTRFNILSHAATFVGDGRGCVPFTTYTHRL